jgi:fatty-acyl-CoA synthase
MHRLRRKRDFDQTVQFNTAAAPPPESVLAGMADAGFDVTHLYGLTETYGPAVVNEWNAEWDALRGPTKAAKKARQGVRYVALDDGPSWTRKRCKRVPADGEHAGRGDVPRQHRHEGLPEEPRKRRTKAFAGGWFTLW